jgi:hypothetical protein
MSANDKQVGGDHYRSEYQHWDFVCDMKLHYLLGNATKYVARYKKKNGLQDLEKAKHYIEKAKQKNVKPEFLGTLKSAMLKQFIKFNKITPLAAEVIEEICAGDYGDALYHLDGLIAANQPKEDTTGQENPFGFNPKEDI